MEQRKNDMILVCVMALFLGVMAVWAWFRTPDEYSESERRVLAKRPKLTAESFFDGEFARDFESYVPDQFPARDLFRSIKAMTELGAFGKMDNNGLYVSDGHISRLEYPLQEKMLDHAAKRFSYIYESYLANTKTRIFFSIIPDKNYFLAPKSGRLVLDYDKLIGVMRQKTPYMQYVDITDSLSLEDYYRTDTHWKQERLEDTAKILADALGITLMSEYKINELETPFYGVYAGQSALPVKPDTIRYLTSEVLKNCTVTSYDTGKPVPKAVYDMEAAKGRDPYEMFLAGSDALLVVDNPMSESERELVVFRDSFASSLIPFLIEGYSKVTLVDIRYVQSSMLGNFVDFTNQDVLFLYSTILLNNSLALK